MLRNHLTIALRRFRRHTGYALINTGGLAVSMACFLLIALYIADELRFDRFHPDADRTYRVLEHVESPDLGTRTTASSAAAVADALSGQIPGVEEAARLFQLWRSTMGEGERRFYEGEYLFADPAVFDVFGFELLAGNPETALAEPNSVVLTESAARKYFGEADAFGALLPSDLAAPGEGPRALRVTGILRDPPPTSHLAFSMLVADATLQAFEPWPTIDASWDNSDYLTYVKLRPGASPEAVAASIEALTASHWDPSDPARRRLSLQPLTAVHLGSGHIENDFNRRKGDPRTLYILGALAALLLVIAGINYMNLATARAATRAREVGLRKVAGASRGQLVVQFLTEAVVTAAAAALLAFALVQVLLPRFGRLTEKNLAIDGTTAGMALLATTALVLLLGLGAGSYPAFYLARFRPARVLKGAPSSPAGGAGLRRGLVALQFGLSIALIASTSVMYAQMRYVQERPLGYDREQLVAIDINSGVARRNFETMKTAFEQVPGVRQAAVSSRVPGDWKTIPDVGVLLEGEPPERARTALFLAVDADFLDVYRIDLAAGRSFAPDRPSDSTAVLLNESAARALGRSPIEAVGLRLRMPGAAGEDADFTARVIGVVSDFHVRSLHEPIAPVVLGYRNNPIQAIDYFTVRIDARGAPETIAALEAAHYRVDEQTLFEYNFLDDRLDDFYRFERKLGLLFGLAAGLALLIACLGLFGLAAFQAERRTKEIGVRKVLGASTGSIVALLSREFLVLTGAGFLLAAPLTYVAMQGWLADFAYRISLGPSPFLIAGLLALTVAVAVVAVQAARAAGANPIHALRSE